MQKQSVKCSAAAILASAVLASTPVACRGSGRTDPSPTEEPAKPLGILPQPALAHATTIPGNANGASIADIAERVLPCVVNIASTKHVSAELPPFPFSDPFFERFFGLPGPGRMPSEPVRGLGSGVLVAQDVILTNYHVVEGADELHVTTSDKRELKADVVGTDPKSDLAVLRIKGKPGNLKPVEFGDSQRLRLGDIVLAVGNPFGVGQTVTMGIVSAKGRADLGIVDYEDFIQTDAAINPGNSGGALVDMEGHLVGVNTAILSRTGGYMGVGFAIPSEMVKPIMESLLKTGKVDRGFLGVTIQPVDPELASALKLPSSTGVLISDVSPDSPAAKAGLQRGDVVTKIDGNPAGTTGQLRNVIAAAGAKGKITLDIVRDSKPRTVEVQLAAAPVEPKPIARANEPAMPPGEDVRVAPITPDLRQRLEVPSSIREGVVVIGIDPSSNAAEAGLRPGDVVLEVNRKKVTSPEQFTKLWKESKGTKLLLVFRAGSTVFLATKR